MRISHSNNSLELAAKKGEVLTLSLAAGDAIVSFSGVANGTLTEDRPHQFTVPDTGRNLPLLVRATFRGTSGGFASIRITDSNGTVAPYTFTQFPGAVANAVVFLIDIE